MLKHFLFLTLSLNLLSGCSAISATQIGEAAIIGASKQKFVKGTDGIPLYPYFTEIKDKTVMFDSTDGKIIRVNYTATGVDMRKVRNFYNDTLPQIGWIKVDEDLFRRDNEELEYQISQIQRRQFLNFKITLSD